MYKVTKSLWPVYMSTRSRVGGLCEEVRGGVCEEVYLLMQTCMVLGMAAPHWKPVQGGRKMILGGVAPWGEVV